MIQVDHKPLRDWSMNEFNSELFKYRVQELEEKLERTLSRVDEMEARDKRRMMTGVTVLGGLVISLLAFLWSLVKPKLFP